MPAVGGAGAGAAHAAGKVKILLLGVPGAGKSTFASRFSGSEVEHNDDAGARVVSLTADDSEDTVELWIAESAEMAPSFFEGAAGALLMFDVSSRISYKEIPNFYRSLLTACPDCPAVLVGLKVDIRDRKVKPRVITFHRKKMLPYMDVCARSNYNVKEALGALLGAIAKRMGAPMGFDLDTIELEKPDAAAEEAVASAAAAGMLYNEADEMPLPEEDDL